MTSDQASKFVFSIWEIMSFLLVLALVAIVLSVVVMYVVDRTQTHHAIRRNANDATSLSGLGWLYHGLGKNREIALPGLFVMDPQIIIDIDVLPVHFLAPR